MDMTTGHIWRIHPLLSFWLRERAIWKNPYLLFGWWYTDGGVYWRQNVVSLFLFILALLCLIFSDYFETPRNCFVFNVLQKLRHKRLIQTAAQFCLSFRKLYLKIPQRWYCLEVYHMKSSVSLKSYNTNSINLLLLQLDKPLPNVNELFSFVVPFYFYQQIYLFCAAQ